MMALENISSGNVNGISFTHLNNAFETGRIHGIWNEADNVNTGFLQLLAGTIPLSSGTIRYGGRRLDHADVAYYNKAGMSGPHQDNSKLVYLFDNIIDPADLASVVRLYEMIYPLRQMGRTILITSTDYRTLKAPTDFIHILSKGAFQARLHARQYHLLDAVFRHMQRS